MNENPTPTEVAKHDTTRQLCWIRLARGDNLLLGGGYDGLVRRWDLSGEEPVEQPAIDGHRGWVQAVAMHPSEPLVYAADSWGRIACLPFRDERPAPKWHRDDAHDGWIRSLSITPDGTRLASAGNDGHVRVHDSATGQLMHEVAVGEDDVFAVAIHPDGHRVVTGDLFCRLRVWDVESGERFREIDATAMHYHDRDQDVCGLRILEFGDEGGTLLAAGAEPTSAGRGHGIPVVHSFDVGTGERVSRLVQGDKNDGFVNDLVRHPDGYLLTVMTGQPGRGKLILHRPGEEQPFATYTKMANTHSLALTADGKRLFVAATNRNSQGNGAVRDGDGNYVGNFSPLHVLSLEG